MTPSSFPTSHLQHHHQSLTPSTSSSASFTSPTSLACCAENKSFAATTSAASTKDSSSSTRPSPYYIQDPSREFGLLDGLDFVGDGNSGSGNQTLENGHFQLPGVPGGFNPHTGNTGDMPDPDNFLHQILTSTVNSNPASISPQPPQLNLTSAFNYNPALGVSVVHQSSTMFNFNNFMQPRQQLLDQDISTYNSTGGNRLGLTSSSSQSSSNSNSSNKQCENCGAKNTPTWRRCPAGKQLLCNACGLYIKNHQQHRKVIRAPDGSLRAARDPQKPVSTNGDCLSDNPQIMQRRTSANKEAALTKNSTSLISGLDELSASLARRQSERNGEEASSSPGSPSLTRSLKRRNSIPVASVTRQNQQATYHQHPYQQQVNQLTNQINRTSLNQTQSASQNITKFVNVPVVNNTFQHHQHHQIMSQHNRQCVQCGSSIALNGSNMCQSCLNSNTSTRFFHSQPSNHSNNNQQSANFMATKWFGQQGSSGPTF